MELEETSPTVEPRPFIVDADLAPEPAPPPLGEENALGIPNEILRDPKKLFLPLPGRALPWDEPWPYPPPLNPRRKPRQ